MLSEAFHVTVGDTIFTMQVRFCRDRFFPTGELGYRGVRGAVGLRYRSLTSLPLLLILVLLYMGLLKSKAKLRTGFIKSQNKLLGI